MGSSSCSRRGPPHSRPPARPPDCGAAFLLEKVTKKSGAQLVCNTEGCGYVEELEAVEA